MRDRAKERRWNLVAESLSFKNVKDVTANVRERVCARDQEREREREREQERERTQERERERKSESEREGEDGIRSSSLCLKKT